MMKTYKIFLKFLSFYFLIKRFLESESKIEEGGTEGRERRVGGRESGVGIYILVTYPALQ